MTTVRRIPRYGVPPLHVYCCGCDVHVVPSLYDRVKAQVIREMAQHPAEHCPHQPNTAVVCFACWIAARRNKEEVVRRSGEATKGDPELSGVCSATGDREQA